MFWQVPVIVSHYMTQNASCSLKNMRGMKLANHITKILELCGAKVNLRERQSALVVTSKDEDFMVVGHEDCEPEAACPVTLEPHSHLPEQSTHRGTPMASAHYSVVNERESGWGFTECKQDNEVRQKKPRSEADFNMPCGRRGEIRSGVSDTTYEKIHVMCEPQNQSTEIETQAPRTCVSGRIELPVKDEKTETQGEENISPTQDAPDEQKDKLVSEIKFVITDSMKGVEDGPWVYQYGGVVDAKTGNPWTGSVQDYCR